MISVEQLQRETIALWGKHKKDSEDNEVSLGKEYNPVTLDKLFRIIELQHLANMNKASQSLPVMYITVVGALPPNIVTLLKAHEFQVFEERYIKNNRPHFRTYISWDYDWSNLKDKLNIHSYIIEK